MKNMKYQIVVLLQLGKVCGVESYVLSPDETKKLYPLMNVDDVYGTLYSPGDGTLDPASWVAALARAATNRGAKVTSAPSCWVIYYTPQ